MGTVLQLDYYYGIESVQFSFYRVPRLLVKDGRFKGLSSDAKLLYGLMLDRMSLSMKNGWFDEENRAYIIYTIDNIISDLGCGKDKAVKVLGELDSSKGIGLIERVRRGLGKPDIIYVKNFATLSDTDGEKEVSNTDNHTEVGKAEVKKSEKPKSGSRKNRSQEVGKTEVKKSEKPKSESRKSRSQEVEKTEVRKSERSKPGSRKNPLQEVGESDPNYNNFNNTDMSYNNPIYPINPAQNVGSVENDAGGTEDNVNSYIALIKENICYEHHMEHDEWDRKELYDELFGIICEIVCVKREKVRIAGEDYPYELVKSKFLKLNESHLGYVIDCMKNTNTKVSNIKQYMVTALYNAPNTMSHYYQQEVQHDMYGGGWIEKGIV